MRAVRVVRHASPAEAIEVRDDVGVPEPAPGQARVAVAAASLNFGDIARCRGGVAAVMGEPPFTLGMDVEFIKQLCDRLSREHFGILFDFCHFGVGKPTSYVQAIYELGDRIQHLHYSDSDQQTSELHFPPGKGKLDLEAMDRALRDIGFRGTSTLDLYGYPLPEQGYRWGLPRYREGLERIGITGGQA